MKIALGVLVLALWSAGAAAREQSPFENRIYGHTVDLPDCEEPDVLSELKGRFETRESDYWDSSLAILNVEAPRQVAMRPYGLDLTPRRYCHATVLLNDLKRRSLDYFVTEDKSYFGYNTWLVEFCIDGLDRNYNFGPSCKTARP